MKLMPRYEYRCANDCAPFERIHSIKDLDNVMRCPHCGTDDTHRRFHSAPVHFAGGRQGFHNHVGNDLYNRTKQKLIDKYGKKAALEQFDTFKVDPEDMPDPPQRKADLSPATLEKAIHKTPHGRDALKRYDHAVEQLDSMGVV